MVSDVHLLNFEDQHHHQLVGLVVQIVFSYF